MALWAGSWGHLQRPPVGCFSALTSAWCSELRSVPAIFCDFAPGMESTVPLSSGVPTGILGFSNFPRHYFEL